MKPSSALILNLLRVHPEGITAYMALQEARCLRLAARISDLKAEGYRITSDIIPVGHGKHVALYRLIEATRHPIARRQLTLEEERMLRDDVLYLNDPRNPDAWTEDELVMIANQSGMDVSRA